jgi:hypothetical protein
LSLIHTDNDLRMDVRELLFFFDESDDSATHANAIKAMVGEELAFALLLGYFRRNQIPATRLEQSCNTGKRTGPRLDGWIRVSDGTSDLYYQVEVKTWSRHSLGGRPLSLSATKDQLLEFRKERWVRYWKNQTFKDKALAKVLIPMKRPVVGARVEPLACLWDAVHPHGSEIPFFAVDLPPGSSFTRIHVFSMSSFLRAIRGKMLTLKLPCTKERMSWLSKIFPTSSVAPESNGHESSRPVAKSTT